MTVSQLVEEVKGLYPNLRPSTLVIWDKSIRPIADLPVDSINKAAVRRYRVQALTDLSASTVVTRMGYVKAIWEKALRWEIIEGRNPWENGTDGLTKASRAPEYRPWEFWEPYHHHPYFVFLWYSGARIAEVAGLHPSNIVMNTAIPYFNFVHQPNRMLKNDASVRRVPIHPACFPFIERFKMSKAQAPGHNWSYKMGKALGLPPGEAAHTLRHAFHTQLRDVGTEEYMIDILTGHAKKGMSAQYGITHFELLRNEIYKLKDHS